MALAITISYNHFILLQSDSPPATHLNALGIHLLVSLFFVSTTLVEFAVVVVLKRRLDGGASVAQNLTPGGQHITKGSPQFGGYVDKSEESSNEKLGNVILAQKKNCGGIKSIQTTDNVDNIAMILFFFSYLIFNCVYWVEHLQA